MYIAAASFVYGILNIYLAGEGEGKIIYQISPFAPCFLHIFHMDRTGEDGVDSSLHGFAEPVVCHRIVGKAESDIYELSYLFSGMYFLLTGGSIMRAFT